MYGSSNKALHKGENNLLHEDIFMKQNNNLSKSLFCFGYLTLILLVILFFAYNYNSSLNNIDQITYQNLPPEGICKRYYTNLTTCLKDNQDDQMNCRFYSILLSSCYDNVRDINYRCHFYTSDLRECYKKSRRCFWSIKDVTNCIRPFKYVKLEDILLFLKEESS